MKSIVNIGKLLVSIACVGALTTSCNSDFLDRPPLGTLDEVTYLSTKPPASSINSDSGVISDRNTLQAEIAVW